MVTTMGCRGHSRSARVRHEEVEPMKDRKRPIRESEGMQEEGKDSNHM